MYNKYNGYNSPQQRVQRFVATTGAPVTVTLIAINIVSFFLWGTLREGSPFRWLLFSNPQWPQQFWRAVTWPLAGGGDPFSLFLACLWAFMICGSLERSWGLRAFLAFFFGCAALTAVSLWVGETLLRIPFPSLAGLTLAVAAPTVAWCVINARESICLYGVFRVPAPVIMALTCVIVWWELGQGVPGMFGLISCGAAYAYARYGRFLSRGYAPARSKTPSPLRILDEDRVPAQKGLAGWFRARQQQRKLEKLWKNSTKNDD